MIERHVVGDRLIQRHELTMSEPDGTITHRLQVAAFVTIRAGQVHELDEYLDSRDAAALLDGMKTAG